MELEDITNLVAIYKAIGSVLGRLMLVFDMLINSQLAFLLILQI